MNDQTVREDDVRPARPDGTCFYCAKPLGTEHAWNCVAFKKIVRVRFTFEMNHEVPHYWDKDSVEFHLNESSWCTSNILHEIEKKHGCLCMALEGEYLRDATADELDDDEAEVQP